MNNNKIKLKEGLILKDDMGTYGIYIYVIGEKIKDVNYKKYSAKAYNIRNNITYDAIISEYNVMGLVPVTNIEYIVYRGMMDVCKDCNTDPISI